MSAIVQSQSVYEIAATVFAAMIDGDEGLLLLCDEGPTGFADPLAAWVEVFGPFAGRAMVVTETVTAHALVRALLDLPSDEPVDEADLIDAFGEIVNVVGGNVKSLLPHQGTLGLPQVASVVPAMTGTPTTDLHLSWRGEPLELTIWLTGTEGGA